MKRPGEATRLARERERATMKRERRRESERARTGPARGDGHADGYRDDDRERRAMEKTIDDQGERTME